MKKNKHQKKLQALHQEFFVMDVQAVSQKLLQQVHCHRQEKEENRDGFLCRSKKFKRNVRQSAK